MREQGPHASRTAAAPPTRSPRRDGLSAAAGAHPLPRFRFADVRVIDEGGRPPGYGPPHAQARPRGTAAPSPSTTPTPAASPTPAGPTISGCTPARTAEVADAVRKAKAEWLPPAIAALSRPLTPAATAQLTTDFKTTAPADVATILANFRKIDADIDAASATYACVSWDPRCLLGSAFTYRGGRTSSICGDAFDFGALNMRRLVIHETAHRQGLMGDVYCDIHDAKYKAMTKAQAIENADSYAKFAGEIAGKYVC